METQMEKEHSLSSEKRVEYLTRKLKDLKKIELRVLRMEKTLLDEWETLTEGDRGTRKSRNSQITHPTGRDWSNHT